MDLIASLFAVLAPVFCMAAIGYVWIKSGRTLDTNQFTPIVVYIGSPCLVFSTLMKSGVGLEPMAEIAVVAILAHVAALAMGAGILTLLKLPIRAFLPSLMLPNTGNMGLPLCLFAFGEVGLALGIAYFTISSLIQFTAGISIAAGGLSLRRFLSTPHIYVVLAAGALLWTETILPVWLTNTVTLIGQFTIPMMLLFLGVSLARLTVESVGRAMILSVVRIMGGLAVGLLLVWGFQLEGVAAGVVLLQSSMPVAVFNYLFAQYYNNNPSEVAGLVVVSTLMSFATLPILLYFIL